MQKLFICIDNKSPDLGSHRMERKSDQLGWKPLSKYWASDHKGPAATHCGTIVSKAAGSAPSANTNDMPGSLGLVVVVCAPSFTFCLSLSHFYFSTPPLESCLPLPHQSPSYSINLSPTSFRLLISIWQQLSNRLMPNNRHLYLLIKWR